MGISFPLCLGSRRVDGDAYVATTSRPKDINADAVVMKVRGDCTRYGEVQFAFQSPREVPLCFSHPTLYQSKQLITITDNETIGRVDRAIKRLRCDMRPNTIGNLVKSDSPTGISLTVGYSPLGSRNGLTDLRQP